METGAHGHPLCRCSDARDVCDRADAQSRADDRGLLPDQAPDDPLEDRAGLVCRLPDRLGSGSNAMGWQWSAGSGPDATPYFRVFNPVTQLDKFDKDRAYVKRWIAEDTKTPSATALSYYDMIPRQLGHDRAGSLPRSDRCLLTWGANVRLTPIRAAVSDCP